MKPRIVVNKTTATNKIYLGFRPQSSNFRANLQDVVGEAHSFKKLK